MTYFNISEFRGNFLIAFAGAALIIFLIKITPLILPAKYYFSFAKLVGYDAGPFIVDPPGVTGQKLCAIFEKYDIPKDRFTHIDCRLDYVSGGARSVSPGTFSIEEKDRIYTLALQGDPEIRSAVKAALENSPAGFPTEDDIRNIALESQTVGRAFDKMLDSYKTTLNTVVQTSVGENVEEKYRAQAPPSEPGEGHGEVGEGEEEGGPGLSEETTGLVLSAYRSAATQLTPEKLAEAIHPITKSKVDEAINESYGWDGLGSSIVDYYKRSLSEDFLRKVLTEQFKGAGLSVHTEDEERRLIFAEINRFSWFDYVVSILIRLAPVVLVGAGGGYLLGRGEVLSIAVAGAMAAFLLSWPLMLMWDHLVQGLWQDKKNIFLMFYAAYILAFFVTARASALLGVKLGQQMHGDAHALVTAGADVGAISINWTKVVANIVGAIVLNIVVYASNVIIPLQASAGK